MRLLQSSAKCCASRREFLTGDASAPDFLLGAEGEYLTCDDATPYVPLVADKIAEPPQGAPCVDMLAALPPLVIRIVDSAGGGEVQEREAQWRGRNAGKVS